MKDTAYGWSIRGHVYCHRCAISFADVPGVAEEATRIPLKGNEVCECGTNVAADHPDAKGGTKGA